MTTLHLIRHGANDFLVQHRLAGRDANLALNDEGREQAQRRAESMREIPLQAILASPLPRTKQTAEPLADLHGLPIEYREELLEIEFAGWTGRQIDELDQEELWKSYNHFRAGNSVPGGEALVDAKARMLRIAIELRERYPDGHVAIVGHGDPLRALIMQLLGMADDTIHRLELGPCSWTELEFGPWGARLLRLAPI